VQVAVGADGVELVLQMLSVETRSVF
jgi:hypothetical protein